MTDENKRKFEIWLEELYQDLAAYKVLYNHLEIRRDTLKEVLDKYRECKEQPKQEDKPEQQQLFDVEQG